MKPKLKKITTITSNYAHVDFIEIKLVIKSITMPNTKCFKSYRLKYYSIQMQVHKD
jgi:hypothetical protein